MHFRALAHSIITLPESLFFQLNIRLIAFQIFKILMFEPYQQNLMLKSPCQNLVIFFFANFGANGILNYNPELSDKYILV